MRKNTFLPMKQYPTLSRVVIILVMLQNVVYALTVFAQDSTEQLYNDQTARHLSLAQAQQIATNNNWDLLAARTATDAAVAQTTIARQFPNPTLSLSMAKINVDGSPSGTSLGNGLFQRSYDTIVAINQLIEIGGKRASRHDEAQAGLDAAQARFRDAKRLLDLAVAQAYIGALQAQSNVTVLEQSARTLREEANIANIRLKAGDISSSDKTQIEITADRFDLDARSAAVAEASARIELAVFLGIPTADEPLVLTDSLETISGVPIENITAAAPRPDLVAAQKDFAKAESELRLQRAQRIPDPSLLLQFEREPPDKPYTIGIGVSFPLPVWNLNGGAIRLAETGIEQAEIALGKIKAQITAEEQVARLAYEDSLVRWRRYHDDIRPKSERIRATVAYSYQKGGASLLDLLLAERTDNDVRMATVKAAADVAVAAVTLKVTLNAMESVK